MDALDKALNMLKQLAETMGQTTAYLWPKVVLYKWTEALIYTLLIPIIFAISFTFFCKAIKEGKQQKWPDEPSLYVRVFMIGFISATFFLAFIFGWPNFVATLVSPEGRVVLTILVK